MRANPWAAFLIHQALVFASAVIFLAAVRHLTGKSIHLARDPVGVVDGAALVILCVGIIVGTAAFYSCLKRQDAGPLGIKINFRRSIEFIVGLLLGAAFFVVPWLISLIGQDARITDTISSHYTTGGAVVIVGVAYLLLMLQAATEETANRAFPLRIWEHRPLWFRLLIPATLFAAIHFMDEPLEFERLLPLILAGVMLDFAYLLTGNIWLTTGLHAGGNIASFALSGMWHAGAIVSITGRLAFPVWISLLVQTSLLAAVYFLKRVDTAEVV